MAGGAIEFQPGWQGDLAAPALIGGGVHQLGVVIVNIREGERRVGKAATLDRSRVQGARAGRHRGVIGAGDAHLEAQYI